MLTLELNQVYEIGGTPFVVDRFWFTNEADAVTMDRRFGKGESIAFPNDGGVLAELRMLIPDESEPGTVTEGNTWLLNDLGELWTMVSEPDELDASDREQWDKHLEKITDDVESFTGYTVTDMVPTGETLRRFNGDT